MGLCVYRTEDGDSRDNGSGEKFRGKRLPYGGEASVLSDFLCFGL